MIKNHTEQSVITKYDLVFSIALKKTQFESNSHFTARLYHQNIELQKGIV